jgi:UDP-3-O-[3-hydroxymyristoyl] glucosamine N-acyltransferase
MISPSAEIGEGTIIQPGVFIGNHVKIGNNCLIHANVSIYDHSIIGDNVIIHSGTVIGADAFYFQRKPHGYANLNPVAGLLLKTMLKLAPAAQLTKEFRAIPALAKGSKFDNHIQIGHDTSIGKNCLFASAVIVAGVTTVEDDVILWGQVAIQKDIVIGKGAVVLATSAVDKSIAGNKVYFGVPAEEARKKWRELAALRKVARSNWQPETVSNI